MANERVHLEIDGAVLGLRRGPRDGSSRVHGSGLDAPALRGDSVTANVRAERARRRVEGEGTG